MRKLSWPAMNRRLFLFLVFLGSLGLFWGLQPAAISVVDVSRDREMSRLRSVSHESLVENLRNVKSEVPMARRQLKAQLVSLAKFRQGRHHWPKLKDQPEENEDALVQAIAELVKESYTSLQYDEQREELRMLALDYLGEKIVGRLASENLVEIHKIVEEILSFEPNRELTSRRKIQSILGDRLEIFRYLVRADRRKALALLEQREGQWDYAALKVGATDGLWASGVGWDELEAMGFVSDTP